MSESSPTPTKEQPPENPLSYKDKIDEAYAISKGNQMAIIRMTDVLDELISKLNKLTYVQIDIRKQLLAAYKLAEEGKPVTSDNVANFISSTEMANIKKSLQTAVDKGQLVALNAVDDKNNLIAYSNTDVAFGSQPVFAFPEEIQESLIGKKVGDEVAGFKVEGVYNYARKTNEETKDDSTNQESPQA
jgi:hypothetical protein